MVEDWRGWGLCNNIGEDMGDNDGGLKIDSE